MIKAGQSEQTNKHIYQIFDFGKNIGRKKSKKKNTKKVRRMIAIHSSHQTLSLDENHVDPSEYDSGIFSGIHAKSTYKIKYQSIVSSCFLKRYGIE